MSFQVKIHPKVAKFISKLETSLGKRIRAKLVSLKDDPFRYLEHFEGADFYKLRVGDHRALIDLDNNRKIIFVRVLDHRKRIYKSK